MKSNEQLILALVLVLGLGLVGAVYFLFFHQAQEPGPPTEITQPQDPTVKDHKKDTPHIINDDNQNYVPAEEEEIPKDPKEITTLVGLVTDKKKKPVIKADVLLYRSKNSAAHFIRKQKPLYKVKTDKQGRFNIGPIYAGDGYRLVADHPLYCKQVFSDLFIKAKEETVFPTIIMDPGKSVFGKVRDPNGAPINGATITIYDPNRKSSNKQGFLPLHMVKTDEEGGYLVQHINDPNFIIQAKAQGFADHSIRNQDLFGKTTKFEFNFGLDKASFIKGMVYDNKKQPLPNASIMGVRSKVKQRNEIWTKSDKDGKFHLQGLGKGLHYLSCSHKEFVPYAIKNIQDGREDIVFILDPRSGVSGQVVNKEDQPVTSFSIAMYRTSKSSNQSTTFRVNKSFTHREGHFTIDGVDPGKYRVEVGAKGYAPFTLPKLEVPEEVFATNVKFQLSRGGSVKGTVMDHKGQPLRQVYVKVRSNNYKPSPVENIFGGAKDYSLKTVRTNMDGQFLVKNINAGTYQLEYSHRNYPACRTDNIVIELDQTTQAPPVSMKKGAIIQGNVYNDSNTPCPGAQVNLRKTDNTYHKTVTADSKGFYIFKNVPPGDYLLCPIPKLKKGQNPFSVIGSVIHSEKKEPIKIKDGITREVPLIIRL